MESFKGEVISIARLHDGWYLIDLTERNLVSGPHETHEDAVQRANTRAYRLAQGWAP